MHCFELLCWEPPSHHVFLVCMLIPKLLVVVSWRWCSVLFISSTLSAFYIYPLVWPLSWEFEGAHVIDSKDKTTFTIWSMPACGRKWKVDDDLRSTLCIKGWNAYNLGLYNAVGMPRYVKGMLPTWHWKVFAIIYIFWSDTLIGYMIDLW